MSLESVYFRSRKEDLITTYNFWCSVLIILTNQIVTFLCDWKYFGSFYLLIWVDFMPEVTWKLNNTTTFIIFKYIALRLKYAIWLVQIMTWYANKKIIQVNYLEHDKWWGVIRSSMQKRKYRSDLSQIEFM